MKEAGYISQSGTTGLPKVPLKLWIKSGSSPQNATPCEAKLEIANRVRLISEIKEKLQDHKEGN
jgi:hypothetical protein